MFTFNLSYKVIIAVVIVILLFGAAFYHYNIVKAYNAKLERYKNEVLKLQNQTNEYTVQIQAYQDSIKKFVQEQDGAHFSDSVITIIVHDTLHDSATVDYEIKPIDITLRAEVGKDTLSLNIIRVKPSIVSPYISIILDKPYVLTEHVTAFNDKNTIGLYGLFSGQAVNTGIAVRLNNSLELLGGININNVLELHDWSDVRSYNLGVIYYIF